MKLLRSKLQVRQRLRSMQPAQPEDVDPDGLNPRRDLMNEIKTPYSPSDVASSVHDDDKWTPDTSKLVASKSGSDSTATNGLLKNAVQGAHATLDRLADGAAPGGPQPGIGRAGGRGRG